MTKCNIKLNIQRIIRTEDNRAIEQMKRKISLTNPKSPAYILQSFQKQFRKSLDHYSIGQMLNHKQVLQVMSYMGFIEQEPTPQDIELAKTITKMLTQEGLQGVRRCNLFSFFVVVCAIENSRDVDSSYFEEEISGLAMDIQESQQPLIVIQLGTFDQQGRWHCNPQEQQQIKTIFSSMRLKRISRNQVEARKRTPKNKNNQNEDKNLFKPKICPRSSQLAEQKFKKGIGHFNGNGNGKLKVENRLLMSRERFKSKIQLKLNQSIEKELQQCTFKPQINISSIASITPTNMYNSIRKHANPYTHSRSNSKENIPARSNSQGHIKNLLDKGNAYKYKKQRLKQLQIKLNQSSQLEQCTFKPQTTKHSQSTKYVYIRNRDKQIQRLRLAQKQRQFLNKVHQRGYPTGINWSQFISKKSLQPAKSPILCIDLKIMQQQYNINVYDGENIIAIAERISRQHKIPERMWWKVQELIRAAIGRCADVRVQNNRIFAEN